MEFSIIPWCVAGSLAGFVLNARSPEYLGIGAFLERYEIRLKPTKVLIMDLVFFCMLGPCLMYGLYSPQAAFQAITLGLSWPFIIRGVITTAKAEASKPGGEPN